MKTRFLLTCAWIFAAAVACNNPGNNDDKTSGADAGTVEEATGKPADQIVGLWKMESLDFGMAIPADQKENIEKEIKKMVDNSSMRFEADGSFTATSWMSNEQTKNTGTWKLGDDGKSISWTDDKTGKIEAIPLHLADNKLTVMVDKGDSGGEIKAVYIKQ